VPTLLANPPAAPTEPQPAAGAAGGSDAPRADAQPTPARSCSKCGAPLAGGQDWCLQCGTGGPDSLRTRAPSWRSAAAILGVLAILVAGAATAAYAALSKGGGKARTAIATVAQAAPPATATPVTPATPAPGATTPKVGTPRTIKPIVPLKAPKIPLSAPTPSTPTPSTPSAVSPITSGGSSTPTPTTPKTTNEGPTVAGEAHPEAILLDTNAAATYNPSNYSASNFGDPSLAIDGDNSTGWTALVDPSVAPRMAEGLVIDLNAPRRISALGLTTSTPGLTVQVYGANGQTPPALITDPAWVALSSSRLVKKKHVRIKLGGTAAASKAAHRFVVLWLSAAPAAAVGTPQAPGHVSINELELFPFKK
jgi:hypothetical protein